MTLISLKGSQPIDGYQITERLGAGGYGEVWKAEAPGGLHKAIKFIYGYLTDEKASRELKALNRIKQIRHPFLLSLERIEVVDGQLLIVTELADSSMKDRFQACQESGLPAIPRDEMLAYLRDAADGLDFLSENALQHLDVKPENLLLVGGRIKVADFGLVKDIQDRTCSMMGGMTPVYAPPEVFDGRPCSYSDQYSLAIVYQEMITGTLPFPGNTAAQLASQHLHSRPRLESLPEIDRPVIARALSKNPAERYPTARAMVEALLAAGTDKARVTAPGEHRISPSGDTTSAAGQDTSAATPNRRSANPRSRGFNQSSSGRGLPGDSGPVSLRDSQAPATIVNLPPVEVSAQDNGLRPTVFLGIGGTGAQVLRRLQRRLVDRFGNLSEVPALQLLLVDTAGHSSRTVLASDLHDANPIPQLQMPLRRPQDYRVDSNEILQWLSRRWLYNIPRSLETEGLRPLGRLALVDHADKLFSALHKALAACTSSEALAASQKSTGLAIRNQAPRVFIVTSISGGTGSGMVIDAAYAVRMVLDELELRDDGICGILAHSTSRVVDGKELAVANAFSCLSELQHFARYRYPGEPSCGLPEAKQGQVPFDSTYFVHLGDRLTDEQFFDATDSLAAYLYLDAATPAGGFFDKCRRGVTPPNPAEMQLRSLGICQMGCKKDLSTSASDALCRTLIQRWAGDPQDGKQPAAGKLAAGDDPVTRLVGQYKLDATALVERFRAHIQQAMQPDPNTVLQRLVKSIIQEETSATAAEPDDVRWLRLTKQAERMLGLTQSEEQPQVASGMQLGAVAEALHPQYLNECAQGLGKELLSLASQHCFRLSGAHDAAKRLVERLRLVEKELTTLLQPMHQQLSVLLAGAQRSSAAGGRSRRSSRDSGLAASALGQALFTHCCLVIDQFAVANAVRVVRSLAQRTATVCESLVNLRRDVMQLGKQFVSADGWNDDNGGMAADTGVKDPDEAVRRELQKCFNAIADQFERRLDDELLTPCGGLARFLGKSADQLQLLPSALRAGARAEVLKALKEIDVTRLVLGPLSEASQESLKQFMQAAWPKALDVGGAKRLLLLMPDSATAAKLPALIEKSRQEKPNVVTGPGGDVVACYEAEQLDLTRVAASLVADDPNYIGVANRLHTRTDVAWTSLI